MAGPWYFKDKRGDTQGPFSTGEMREWYVAGYFKGDLLVTDSLQKGFNALRDWYPNLALAFVPNAEGRPGRSPARGAGGNAAKDNSHEYEHELKWHFMDRSNNMQGPYSTSQMRRWFEGGYFEPSLQIYDASKSTTKAGWKSLREYFPNVKMAFAKPAPVESKFMSPHPVPPASPIGGGMPSPAVPRRQQSQIQAQGSQVHDSGGSGQGRANNNPMGDRFKFNDWLPQPPGFQQREKIYPSEKKAVQRSGITDIYGNLVEST